MLAKLFGFTPPKSMGVQVGVGWAWLGRPLAVFSDNSLPAPPVRSSQDYLAEKYLVIQCIKLRSQTKYNNF